MIDALEPLARIPGVRFVALVAPDGVPIAVPGIEGQTSCPPAEAGGRGMHDTPTGPDAMAALSTGWVSEISTAIAPLSWDVPTRIVLRAKRGTLVMRQAHGSWLLVLLNSGLRSEDVILSMEGTAARIERIVRGMGSRTERRPAAGTENEPPGPLPSRSEGERMQENVRGRTTAAGHQRPKGR